MILVPAHGPGTSRNTGARSASYLFEAPQWGCPWRVPPTSVAGLVRCGDFVCVDTVTHASRSPCRLYFDEVLGRCPGAVLCLR